MAWITVTSNFGDALTGERVLPGERVFDTGFTNKSTGWMSRGRTRVLKEATLVKVLEDAGYIVKRDERDSGDAKSVDGEDVSVGGGEAEAGKAEVGGGDAPKRRSSRTTKSK